ncbi:hypothetical protein ABKN59_009483 [Abortiporus biennis]
MLITAVVSFIRSVFWIFVCTSMNDDVPQEWNVLCYDHKFARVHEIEFFRLAAAIVPVDIVRNLRGD